MFEKASRLKLRFTYKGNISVEDLWDLTIDDLDNIYRTLKKQCNEVDSLKKNIKPDEVLQLKIDIVKHIFNVKEDEALKREEKAIKQLNKRRLLDILAHKKDEELQKKSVEELIQKINELDD